MKTVAVIGASSERHKFGNKAVRAFLQQGFTVFPVHPTETEVEGLKVYRTVGEIPAPLNMVTVYVPPPVGLKLLPQIAEKGCDELWLNPGADGPQVVEKARELGLNVIQACSIVAIGVPVWSL